MQDVFETLDEARQNFLVSYPSDIGRMWDAAVMAQSASADILERLNADPSLLSDWEHRALGILATGLQASAEVAMHAIEPGESEYEFHVVDHELIMLAFSHFQVSFDVYDGAFRS